MIRLTADIDMSATEDIRERIADVRSATQVAATIRGFYSDVFRSRGRRVGGWAPLAPSYLRTKSGGQPGVVSGGLRRSLTTKGAKWHVNTSTRDSFSVGTKAPHATLYSQGRKSQPGRRLNLYDDQLTADLTDDFRDYLMGVSGRGV